MVVRHWTGGNSADLLDRIMDSVETEAPAEGIRVRSESARRSFLGGAVDLAELDSLLVVTNGVFQLGPNTLSYTVIYNGDSNYGPSAVSKCEPVCAINFTTSQP